MYLVQCKFEMNGREYTTLPQFTKQFYSKLEATYYASEIEDDLINIKATKVYVVIHELVHGNWKEIYALRRYRK